MSRGDHDVDEEVEVPDKQATDRTAHKTGKQLEMRVPVDWPGPGVSHNQTRESIPMLEGCGQSDGSSPVLCDQGDVMQIQAIHELAHHSRMVGGMELISGRRVDNPNPGNPARCTERSRQLGNYVPIDKRPSWVAVQHQQHWPVALVDVWTALPLSSRNRLVRKKFIVNPRRRAPAPTLTYTNLAYNLPTYQTPLTPLRRSDSSENLLKNVRRHGDQNSANCSPARGASVNSSTPVPPTTAPTQSMNFASDTSGTPSSWPGIPCRARAALVADHQRGFPVDVVGVGQPGVQNPLDQLLVRPARPRPPAPRACPAPAARRGRTGRGCGTGTASGRPAPSAAAAPRG